jgi:6-pyruvoyl-tetrahydropterin synthase
MNIYEGKNSSARSIFIEDITRIDCSVFSPSQGIMGQSWHVDIELTGVPDEHGFIYDFGKLRKLVRAVFSSTIDHALLIPIMSKQVSFTETAEGERWNLTAFSRLTNQEARWEYICPKGAVYPMRTLNINLNAVEQECARLIRHRLPTQIEKVSVKLREEIADYQASFFRYTHGITVHEGMCQRLFHGHRSLLTVRVDGERREDLENFVTHELFGSSVHIAGSKQIVDGEYLVGHRSKANAPVVLSYEVERGRYQASLPGNHVFVVDGETTIETIAFELVKVLKEKLDLPSKIQVICHEGIGKGAIAEL